MFALVGVILIIIGILGLISVLALGTLISALLIIGGVVLIAYDQGAFTSRR